MSEEREPERGGAAVPHKPTCAFLRSHPIEGDEAALCDCGAVEERYIQWLHAQFEATS